MCGHFPDSGWTLRNHIHKEHKLTLPRNDQLSIAPLFGVRSWMFHSWGLWDLWFQVLDQIYRNSHLFSAAEWALSPTRKWPGYPNIHITSEHVDISCYICYYCRLQGLQLGNPADLFRSSSLYSTFQYYVSYPTDLFAMNFTILRSFINNFGNKVVCCFSWIPLRISLWLNTPHSTAVIVVETWSSTAVLLYFFPSLGSLPYIPVAALWFSSLLFAPLIPVHIHTSLCFLWPFW